MFQCLDLFPLASLLLAAVSTAGQILPPQNLSLSWINEFRIELTWEPAPHSMTHCHYKVVGKTDYSTFKVQSYADDVCMEGGFLSYALSIVCGNNHSEPAVLEISYPELVKTLDCYIYSSKKGHCSWSPAWNTTDLRFFYWLDSQFSYEPRTELQECSLYSYTGDVKTGCDFPANSLTIIQMLFNATLNNTVVWNTFCRDNLKVKPPAPTWTVIKTKNEFNISWNTSDMPEIQPWEFRINYTACNKEDLYTSRTLGQVGSQLALLTLDTIFLTGSTQAGGSGPFGPEPLGIRTISYPLLLDS